MKELIVEGGDTISRAAKKLVAEAPAFCVFNDIRLIADVGDTVESVLARYGAESQIIARINEEMRSRAETDRQATFVAQILNAERQRVVGILRSELAVAEKHWPQMTDTMGAFVRLAILRIERGS